MPAIPLQRCAVPWIQKKLTSYFDLLSSSAVASVISQSSVVAAGKCCCPEKAAAAAASFCCISSAVAHVSLPWLDKVILLWHSEKSFWLIKKWFSAPIARVVTGFFCSLRMKLNSYCSSQHLLMSENPSEWQKYSKPVHSNAEKHWEMFRHSSTYQPSNWYMSVSLKIGEVFL